MIKRARAAVFHAAIVLISVSGVTQAYAGDCVARVVGVKPISQYNHAAGRGFLAVRSAPGGKQVGEVYRNDEVSVFGKRGKWYQVSCLEGRCMNPKWGPAFPEGWVHGGYLAIPHPCP